MEPRLTIRGGRSMDQHRAGMDELLDIGIAQAVQQTARAIYVDRLISGLFLAGKIEIGGKVDDGCDLRAVIVAQT